MTSQIGFLSDFGLADHYVGVVHAVFAELCPEAHVLDITHGVPPGDVLAAVFSWGRTTVSSATSSGDTRWRKPLS